MRVGKALLVLGMGLFLGIAALNNITMSAGGYGAVSGAVGMQGTFGDPAAMWRAIESPVLVWIAFGIIVAGEVVAAILCIRGAWNLWSARGSASSFNASKSTALLGLTVCACLYFVLFHAIAQEWFLLWQVQDSQVMQSQFRNFASAVLLMLWINSEDQ